MGKDGKRGTTTTTTTGSRPLPEYAELWSNPDKNDPLREGVDPLSRIRFLPHMLGPCDAIEEASVLAEALDEGGGSAKARVMEILTSRSPTQIAAIATEFGVLAKKGSSKAAKSALRASGNTKEGLDPDGCVLVQAIKSHRWGNLKNIFVSLARGPILSDVVALHDAMSGLGTNEDILIASAVLREPDHVSAVAQAYADAYDRPLESAVSSETSGHLRDLLVQLYAAKRELEPIRTGRHVDSRKVDKDASKLVSAFAPRSEDKAAAGLISLVARSSVAHCVAVAKAYAGLAGEELRVSIDTYFADSDFGRAILGAIWPGEFLAYLIYRAVRRLGTNDDLLVFSVTHASPRVLLEARISFAATYKRPMVRRIEADTSGAYRKAIRRVLAYNQGAYDAVRIREATKGLGTDEKTCLHVVAMAALDSWTSLELHLAYEADYGRSIEDTLRAELSGNLSRLLATLATERSDYMARLAAKAVSGINTSEATLTDVLCTRTQAELERVAATFASDHAPSPGVTLADRVAENTSGSLGELFLAILSLEKQPRVPLSSSHARSLAEELYSAGESRVGTSDSVFARVFGTHSPEQLQAISAAYAKAYKHDLARAVEKETSGDFERALLACLDPYGYLARRAHSAVKGLGTDDKMLIQVLAHRSRAELDAISEAYASEFGTTLRDAVESETSGKYRSGWRAYLTHNPHLIHEFELSLNTNVRQGRRRRAALDVGTDQEEDGDEEASASMSDLSSVSALSRSRSRSRSRSQSRSENAPMASKSGETLSPGSARRRKKTRRKKKVTT